MSTNAYLENETRMQTAAALYRRSSRINTISSRINTPQNLACFIF